MRLDPAKHLEEYRKISCEEGKALLKNKDWAFFECSSKEGMNVDLVFKTIAEKVSNVRNGSKLKVKKRTKKATKKIS